MTNGVTLKMQRGSEIIRFWVFDDGTVQEYTTKCGVVEVKDFISRYKELQSMGFMEV